LATTSVLLVEDNETSKKVLEKILKPCSKSVHSVANLEAAIIALQQGIERQNPYSLLIVDSKATEKRNKAKNRQIFATVNTMYQLPIILLTAFSTHEKLTTDYIGVEKLVSKPVTAEALFKGICEVFQKKDSTKNCLTTISNKKEVLKISDKQILLAEDNPINQQVARELLQIEGFSVTVVDDGQQALNILKTQSFDLILMDVQMPHLDGYEATKIIRQTYKTKPLPIIAMTAHALQLDREKCLAAGMDDYISKPINPELLSQLLVKYLGQEAELAPILSMPDAGSLYPQIAGIDFLDGLKRVRNNQNLYFKLLNMFITKHGNAVNDIKLAIASNTYKEAISIAHTIKGAATNLGLREISILAGAIEFSLLNNESVTDTQINLFSDALHEFINAVQLIPKE
jgi:CheY-like chemotaxis protein/HPt (histidine-containing phosphotransfer) domain-containing protein